MLASVVAVLAFGVLAFAVPPAAQSTYCYEDNLLRAFQNTPTPASKYCTATTGYPTFLKVTSYPATRLSSACSCFSRFPIDCSTPAPQAGTTFKFSSVGSSSGTKANLLLTIDLGTRCKNGYAVTKICGTFGGQPVHFTPGDENLYGDNCFYPGGPGVNPDGDFYNGVDFFGVNFQTSDDDWNIFYNVGFDTEIGDGLTTDFYPGSFQPVACATCPS